MLGACHPAAGAPRLSHYLFAWAGDADHRSSDFLAVLDVLPSSPTYGRVVTTLPVGDAGTRPHHTEHEMPAGGILFANGFMAGRTYRLDLRQPLAPRLLGHFDGVGPLSFPHSFVRLPNGHVLATFQYGQAAAAAATADGGKSTGGLAELDEHGRLVRWASAAVPADPAIRPYSLAVVPALDRVVSTTYEMYEHVWSRTVQVWQLSTLRLVKTIELPAGPRGNENLATAEPRVLADGRTVLVNTFRCGLYRLEDLAGADPRAELVYTAHFEPGLECALPVVIGDYWIQTVGADHSLVTLDVHDSAHPREVSRLALGPTEVPHWLAREPGGFRLAVSGFVGLEHRILLATVDPATGKVRLVEDFHDAGAARPGLSFEGPDWPHGRTGAATPHAVVFSRG